MKLRSMRMLALALTFTCHGVVAQAGEGGCSGGCASLLKHPVPCHGATSISWAVVPPPRSRWRSTPAWWMRSMAPGTAWAASCPTMKSVGPTPPTWRGITFTGGHPAPDALDGAQVLKASARQRASLKWCSPGAQSPAVHSQHEHRLRERSRAGPRGGHYTFFATSTLFRIRQADPVRATSTPPT